MNDPEQPINEPEIAHEDKSRPDFVDWLDVIAAGLVDLDFDDILF